jgi:hypothetical protein
MAIGTKSDFKIYNEQFFGGFTELLMQNADIFNAASAGTILVRPRRLKGDYEQESFVPEIASLITRRDVTSVSAATDLKMTQLEKASVKINRKIGPIAQTLDAWKKIAEDPQMFSLLLGQQTAKAALVDYVDTAIKAAIAALGNNSSVVYDGSAGTMTHTALATGLSKFGDAAKSIKCFVMHSKVWFDLVKQSITDKITNVADVTINQGTAASLNRPVIVTDSAELVVSGTPNNYYTLGLVQAGIEIDESEEKDVESQIVTGLENLVMRIQGEYAYNLGMKGFTWDITNGGANPTNSSIGTASNWDQVATDYRSLAGVRIKTQ